MADRGGSGGSVLRCPSARPPEPCLSHENLTYDDLLRIVELIKTSEQFSEFRLKIGDIEVELRRRGIGGPSAASAAPAAPPESGTRPPDTTTGAGLDVGQAGPAAQRAPPPASARPEVPAWPEESVVVRAPMVGTFYRAPEPGAAPFVDVGSAVDDHTTVCIIEVMKLMNSIAAGVRGTVTHVLVADATPVDTGEPLIVVLPELPAP